MQIMLVEDEPRLGLFLVHALMAEGLQTEQVRSDGEALGRALAGEPELVIVDLGDADAARMALLMEFQQHLPRLALVVLSDNHDLATRLRAFSLGAVDFLGKPFAVAELLARVRVHRRYAANGPQGGNTLRAGGLVLDKQAREAYFRGRVTKLTDREFRLLRHLLADAGHVVSRERLLSSVWGYDFDPRSNVVDVCVRRLRQRLGPDAPIETVRNAGYRISTGRPVAGVPVQRSPRREGREAVVDLSRRRAQGS